VLTSNRLSNEVASAFPRRAGVSQTPKRFETSNRSSRPTKHARVSPPEKDGLSEEDNILSDPFADGGLDAKDFLAAEAALMSRATEPRPLRQSPVPQDDFRSDHFSDGRLGDERYHEIEGNSEHTHP
jgi:hypothetical protein